MSLLRKQNIKIATKVSIPEEDLGLKIGEIGTDGQNFFMGSARGNIALTIPIGSILAWHPAGFLAPGNSGYTNLESLINLPQGYLEADGSYVKDVDSPFNECYLPDLTSNMFLMGTSSIVNTVLGQDYSFGGINHSGPPIANGNNGDATITITSNFLPPHVHPPGTLNVTKQTSVAGSHSHTYNQAQWGTANMNGGGVPSQVLDYNPAGTSAVGDHIHTLTINPGAFAGTTGTGGFANAVISIMPKYISVKYIIRIK